MLQISKTCADMQLLPRVCFCFLTLSGLTFGDRSGPPATRVTVKEDDDVVLPCSLGTSVNIESELFDWRKEGTVPRKEVFMYDPDSPDTLYRGQDEQFKGRVSHFPGELKQGNASIRITKARLEDKGNYTCIFPRTQPSQKVFTIELVVGAAPKPIVRMLDENGLLQCDIEGAFPKPTVEWWDSANKTLPTDEPLVSERGGRFHITLKTSVTKSGLYQCVSTQREIWHQISTETFVNVSGFPTGWVVAGVLGLLFVVLLLALLVNEIKRKREIRYHRKRRSDEMVYPPPNQPVPSETTGQVSSLDPAEEDIPVPRREFDDLNLRYTQLQNDCQHAAEV